MLYPAELLAQFSFQSHTLALAGCGSSNRAGLWTRARSAPDQAAPDLPRAYGRITNRGERIRTSDTLLPKQVRYQAALRPGKVVIFSGSACPSLGSTPASLPQVIAADRFALRERH